VKGIGSITWRERMNAGLLKDFNSIHPKVLEGEAEEIDERVLI
jgi:hypothetical protein